MPTRTGARTTRVGGTLESGRMEVTAADLAREDIRKRSTDGEPAVPGQYTEFAEQRTVVESVSTSSMSFAGEPISSHSSAQRFDRRPRRSLARPYARSLGAQPSRSRCASPPRRRRHDRSRAPNRPSTTRSTRHSRVRRPPRWERLVRSDGAYGRMQRSRRPRLSPRRQSNPERSPPSSMCSGIHKLRHIPNAATASQTGGFLVAKGR
jgi:hypothetical protein